jgi:NAD(P)-dependent dehydrogenase (short-subunit alcohol dehydrogenase family)
MTDQSGKLVVITGGTDGLGRGLAAHFAAAGATVVLPARDAAKADRVVHEIGGDVTALPMDLGSLASVAAFTRTLRDAGRPVDLLINNAGVMNPPARHTTADGFELQFGTNYLGHFALVAHLMPVLRAGRARVTTMVSFGAKSGRMDWADLQSERSYRPMRAYSQSKLATMLFGLELDRRSRAGGWGLTSNLAHPGLTSTNLQANGPSLGRDKVSPMAALFRRLSRVGGLVQTVDDGLRPALYAATSPAARGGAFYGPGRPGHFTGAPVEQAIYPSARDAADGRRLWELSEGLMPVTGDTMA